MTKEEMLRLVRLLAAVECALLFGKPAPDYLMDELVSLVEVLEREILK